MVVAFALNKDGLNIDVLVTLSSLNKFLVVKFLSFVFEVAVTLVVAVVEVVPVVAVVPFVTVDKNFFAAEDNLGVDDELVDEDPATTVTVDEEGADVAKASADEAALVVAAASVVSVSRAIVVGDVVYWLTFLARYLSQLRSSSSIKE